MIKERDYLWDNIKALLICLVVTGHCIEVSAVHHSLTRAVNYWIYSFHMPAFIFVSGFWAKSYCKNGRVRAEKLATLICYYTAFQILFSVLKLIFNIKTSSISFFSPARGLWYLLAMIFFYLLVPLAERLPSYIVLPALITLGVGILLVLNPMMSFDFALRLLGICLFVAGMVNLIDCAVISHRLSKISKSESTELALRNNDDSDSTDIIDI